MKTEQKSLGLAKLMKWQVEVNRTVPYHPKTMVNTGTPEWFVLRPYSNDHWGLAQFAAILLKFPDVMKTFSERCYCGCKAEDCPKWTETPSQENILDEILRMNGVET